MTSMPALRLCLVVILGYVAVVHSTPILIPLAPFIWCGLLVLACIQAVRGKWSRVRTCACAALVFMLASRVTSEYVPSTLHTYDTDQPARIEGTVDRVMTVRTKMARLLVDGEVDCQRLPAVRTRVLLTVFCDRTSVIPESGARIVMFARVRRPDPATLPNEFNEQAMCKSLHVSFVGTAAIRDVDIRGRPSLTRRFVENTQSAVSSALHAHCDSAVAAVLSAVIIGDDSGLQRDARQAYARSGTAHMFSVSGSHVSVLLALGLAITVGIRNRWLRAILLITLIITYVIVSGGSSPAWRAAVMGLLALWGRNTERDVIGLNVLAVAVLCMIILDPLLPWSAGFQLSVTATIAILALAPRWNSLLKQCTMRDSAAKQFLRVSCAVSLAATAGTSLPSALIFDQVPVWSVLANLFVVPILSIAMVAGWGLVLVHHAAPWLAPSLAWVCSLLVYMADGIATMFASWQPEMASAGRTVCLSVLTMGICIWPLIADSWRGILARQAVCVAFIVAVVFVPSPPCSRVQQFQRRSGYVVLMYKHDQTVVLTALRKSDRGVEQFVRGRKGKVDVVALPRSTLHHD